MAATYDANLPTEKDRVRFLINDRLVDGTWTLTDEEIVYWIGSEGNEFLAAAICMPLMLGALSANPALLEKWVGPLKVKFGETDINAAVTSMIEWLRERGAEQTITPPRTFKVLSC